MQNRDKNFDNKKPSDKKENDSEKGKDEAEKKGFPGYPHYPASEDIYNREKETDLNPDDLTKKKTQDNKPGKRNEKYFSEDITGEDLDNPGSKADEAKSNAGSEDEENNHYNLGGDNRKDLEDDKG